MIISEQRVAVSSAVYKRRVKLHVYMGGTVVISRRRRGPDGTLPLYSTDTRKQALRLLTRFCRLSREDNETYELPRMWVLDDLLNWTARFDELYEQMLLQAEVPDAG